MIGGVEVFHLLDQGCFGGEGGGGDNEGFGGFGRKTGEELLLYSGRATIHGLELGGLPKAGEGRSVASVMVERVRRDCGLKE